MNWEGITYRRYEKKPIYPKINNTLCVEKTTVADVWFWRHGRMVSGGGGGQGRGTKRKKEITKYISYTQYVS
jgi:hypothetical protein